MFRGVRGGSEGGQRGVSCRSFVKGTLGLGLWSAGVQGGAGMGDGASRVSQAGHAGGMPDHTHSASHRCTYSGRRACGKGATGDGRGGGVTCGTCGCSGCIVRGLRSHGSYPRLTCLDGSSRWRCFC